MPHSRSPSFGARPHRRPPSVGARPRRRLLALAAPVLAATLVLAPSRPAGARIMPVFEAREQLAAAEAVVRGTITELRDAGPATDPYTRPPGAARRMIAAVAVDVVVKGAVTPGPVSIELLTSPPAAIVFDGLPIYTKGETYLFFLRRGAAHWELVHHDIGARPASATAPGPAASVKDPAARLVALHAASLEGASYMVAIESLDALGSLGGKVAAAAAARAFTAASPDVRAHAYAAAIRAGDMRAIPAAVRFVETADPAVHPTGQPQQWVRLAVGAHTTRAALPELHRLVLHRDAPLRTEVARALRRLRRPESLKHLVTLLDDAVFETRYHAVLGLAEIRGKSLEWAPAMTDPAAVERAVALWKGWWASPYAPRAGVK